jgi:hypothetical protein
MEQNLSSGFSEGQTAKFVEDDEVHRREIVGDAALTPGAFSPSSRLTRSTVVKKRFRNPARMQLRAITIARGACARSSDRVATADDQSSAVWNPPGLGKLAGGGRSLGKPVSVEEFPANREKNREVIQNWVVWRTTPGKNGSHFIGL